MRSTESIISPEMIAEQILTPLLQGAYPGVLNFDKTQLQILHFEEGQIQPGRILQIPMNVGALNGPSMIPPEEITRRRDGIISELRALGLPVSGSENYRDIPAIDIEVDSRWLASGVDKLYESVRDKIATTPETAKPLAQAFGRLTIAYHRQIEEHMREVEHLTKLTHAVQKMAGDMGHSVKALLPPVMPETHAASR